MGLFLSKSMLDKLKHLASYVLAIPRYGKQLIVMSVDTCLCILSVWVSFYLRL